MQEKELLTKIYLCIQKKLSGEIKNEKTKKFNSLVPIPRRANVLSPPTTFAVDAKTDPAVPTPLERAEPATVKMPKVFACLLPKI